jgi:hypothetical protein
VVLVDVRALAPGRSHPPDGVFHAEPRAAGAAGAAGAAVAEMAGQGRGAVGSAVSTRGGWGAGDAVRWGWRGEREARCLLQGDFVGEAGRCAPRRARGAGRGARGAGR